MPRIGLKIGGQSYTMVSREPRPPNRRALIIPMLLLPLAMFVGWYCLVRPPSFAQLVDNNAQNEEGVVVVGTQPKIQGSVKQADRLPSWLREKAISKLPFARTNVTNSDLSDVNEWASYTKRKNNSTVNSTVVDVIIVGSVDRVDYMHAQQRLWAMRQNSVRNVFMATEINTYKSIKLGDGGCKELMHACIISNNNQTEEDENNQLQRYLTYTYKPPLRSNNITNITSSKAEPFSSLLQSNDEEICLQRRIGLAMGASTRRYRKIKHALSLVSSTSQGMNSGVNDDKSPDYLIVTFDSTYFNTQRLDECMGHGGGKNVANVYSPFVNHFGGQSRGNIQQYNTSSTTQFYYPSKNTGVVFNKPALKMWIRQIPCFASKSNSSFVPSPIQYDYNTHSFEYDFCKLLNTAKTKTTNYYDVFEIVIQKTLQISRTSQPEDETKGVNEFVYSSIYQTLSISDIFSIYASTQQVLCKSMSHDIMLGNIERIPTVEEMMGYLINRFKLSSDGLSLSCTVASDETSCYPNMVACANLSLEKMRSMVI